MIGKLLITFVLGCATLVISACEQNPGDGSNATDIESSTTTSQVLTLTDDTGKLFELSTNSIPEYEAYLDIQDDAKTEIERTQYEIINTSNDEQVILLMYGCGNKQCSTLLIKVKDSEVSSVTLANGIFQDYKISPGQDGLLVRYGYNEGGVVVRHILVAIDLQKMKVMPFDSTELAEEYMYTPTWPIIDYRWIDDEKFLMEKSDLTSSDFETVKNWYATAELQTKIVEISLNKTKRLEAYEAKEK